MPTPDLCTEAECLQLVHAFYGRVREADVLAQSLWYGDQLSRQADTMPEAL